VDGSAIAEPYRAHVADT